MSTPRRLSFAVGTSLLTASLSLGVAGCTDKPKVNEGPEKKPEEFKTVNEGPESEPPEKVNPGPEEGEEGPKPEEEPLPSINPGPAPEPPPEPPKRVNPGPTEPSK
ncbi:MAG: hypothetical protein R6X02_18340 [Enhygromyxa sp.]